MANLFEGPGIARIAGIFEKDAVGIALVKFRSFAGTNNGSPATASFLIQSWSVMRSERTQEVVTLAETEHIYTFGKNLPKVTVSGYFINPNTGASIQNQEKADAIPPLWKENIRAKLSGERNLPLVIVQLEATKDVLECVADSITYSGNVNQESLIEATLQLTVING